VSEKDLNNVKQTIGELNVLQFETIAPSNKTLKSG
jgi:hypothetical protein